MTLDEAIAHAREVAERKRRAINFESEDNIDDDIKMNCLKCAEEHEQLAEWLKELKAYKSDDFTKNLQTLVYKQGYNKAIDDFVNQFNVIVDEKCGTDTNNYFRKIVKEIAEQLKAGEENVQKK